MFPAYKLYTKGFFRKAVMPKGATIPAPELGIEFAENLSPFSIRYNAAPPPQRANIPTIKTLDDIQHEGEGAMVNPKNIPYLGYMGESYGY